MQATKLAKWTEGDEGWEVDWCKEMPMIDFDTYDRDNEKRCVRDFKTRAEATAYAKSVLAEAIDKDVCITPFVLERLVDEHPFHVQHNCSKEYTGDSEYYDED